MLNQENLHENAEGIYLSMHSLYVCVKSRCTLCKFTRTDKNKCTGCKVHQLLRNAEKFISLVNIEADETKDINSVEVAKVKETKVVPVQEIKKKRGRPKKVKSEELFK